MLSVLPPYDLTEASHEGAIWGDIEAFMESFERGAEAACWYMLCAAHLGISDKEIRSMMGASVVLPGCV